MISEDNLMGQTVASENRVQLNQYLSQRYLIHGFGMAVEQFADPSFQGLDRGRKSIRIFLLASIIPGRIF